MAQCPSWCTPGLSQPASIYNCHGSTISPFLDWLSLGTPLYNDLVIIAENLSELLEKFRVWKAKLESTGLCVYVGKTKILVSAHNVPKLVDGSKFSLWCVQ